MRSVVGSRARDLRQAKHERGQNRSFEQRHRMSLMLMAQPYYRAVQTAFTAFYEFANEVFTP